MYIYVCQEEEERRELTQHKIHRHEMLGSCRVLERDGWSKVSFLLCVCVCDTSQLNPSIYPSITARRRVNMRYTSSTVSDWTHVVLGIYHTYIIIHHHVYVCIYVPAGWLYVGTCHRVFCMYM